MLFCGVPSPAISSYVFSPIYRILTMSNTSLHKVFMSYSHDSQQHINQALELANRFRKEGVDCWIDQYQESPSEGWAQWASNQITEAEFVLVVCSETYLLRFTGKAQTGTGLGVKWEGAFINQQIYDAEGHNRKFIPIILSPDNVRSIPNILRGVTYYDMSIAEGYDALYRRLTHQPSIVPPDIGPIKPLPPLERKYSFRPISGHSAIVDPPSIVPTSHDHLQLIAVGTGCICLLALTGGLAAGAVSGKLPTEVLGINSAGGGLLGILLIIYLTIKTGLGGGHK